MRRGPILKPVLFLTAAAAALALFTGTAHAAGTPAVVEFTLGPAGPATLPSATVPNQPGSLRLPDDFTTPPAFRAELGFPELQALWQRAGAAYGIPWQVLASINRIESNFGQNMGPSSAGAVGWMQFMPSTWHRWGTDGDGNGVADPWDPEDGIFSAARYLAAAGGATDLPRAIFAYNHAQWYVDEVLAGARLYGAGNGAIAFTVDRQGLRVDAAEAAVAEAEAALEQARRTEARLAARELAFNDRIEQADLFSERLELEQRAGQAGFRRADAAAKVERLTAELDAAAAELERVRQGALSASLAPGVAGLAPVYAGEYVFPVVGGAGAVSVSHTHHDYPAADIAAPAGAPLLALTEGWVVDAWPQGSGSCGIGLVLQAGDGREWTYCHLSYLEPFVMPGMAVAAGSPVGFVGSTGHSTGPHLHLQLAGTVSYPQDEPWFQAFAGTAFAWQDEAAGGSAPVFALVEEPSVVSFSRGTSQLR